jgi:hypothetical protein
MLDQTNLDGDVITGLAPKLFSRVSCKNPRFRGIAVQPWMLDRLAAARTYVLALTANTANKKGFAL